MNHGMCVFSYLVKLGLKSCIKRGAGKIGEVAELVDAPP